MTAIRAATQEENDRFCPAHDALLASPGYRSLGVAMAILYHRAGCEPVCFGIRIIAAAEAIPVLERLAAKIDPITGIVPIEHIREERRLLGEHLKEIYQATADREAELEAQWQVIMQISDPDERDAKIGMLLTNYRQHSPSSS